MRERALGGVSVEWGRGSEEWCVGKCGGREGWLWVEVGCRDVERRVEGR